MNYIMPAVGLFFLACALIARHVDFDAATQSRRTFIEASSSHRASGHSHVKTPPPCDARKPLPEETADDEQGKSKEIERLLRAGFELAAERALFEANDETFAREVLERLIKKEQSTSR